MTLIISDPFTHADADLAGLTPSGNGGTGAGAWTRHTASGGGGATAPFMQIGTNRAQQRTAASVEYWYNATAPGVADYTCQVDMIEGSSQNVDSESGLLMRYDTTLTTGYVVEILGNVGASAALRLIRANAGTSTILQTTTFTLVAATTYTLNASVTGAVWTIKLSNDGGVTWFVSPIAYTDASPISAAGNAGLLAYGNSPTAGYQFDNFTLNTGAATASFTAGPDTIGNGGRGGTVVVAGGTSQRIIFTGTGTTWAAAPNITAGTGVLGAITRLSNTTAWANFTPPAGAGTVTFTDVTDGSVTTTLTVTAAATTYTLAGPSTGLVNVASTPFTAALLAATAVNVAVVITEVDSSAAGTLTPATVTIPANTPGVGANGTFTYTPTTVGARTISSTNGGGLGNPAGVGYTATAGGAPPVTSGVADAHKNFAASLVATAPSPASSGTSLVVTAADGAKFPAAPFNVTIWPAGTQPTSVNAEIARVTAVATDTFTVTRSQEASSARTVVVGDLIAATITVKTLTDVENAIVVRKDVWLDVKKDYGAKGDGFVLYDAVTTAGSAVVTSAGNGFAAAVIGQTVSIAAAGTGVFNFVSTILSKQSSGQITLNATVTTSRNPAPACVVGTDDTVAIQSAITAARVASVNAGGTVSTVYFPAGLYMLNGAFDGTYYGQLQVPSVSYAATGAVVQLLGSSTPNTGWYVMTLVAAGNTPHMQGSIIYSAKSGSGLTHSEAIISCGPVTGGSFSNIRIKVKDLTFRVPSPSNIVGLNFFWAGQAEVDGCVVDIDIPTPADNTLQTQGYGLYMPAVNNGAWSYIRSFEVLGQFCGVLLAEHCVVSNYQAMKCLRGVQINGTTSHGISFVRLLIQHTKLPVYATGSGSIPLVGGYLCIERDGDGTYWCDSGTVDITDASNLLHGPLWYSISGGSGYGVPGFQAIGISGATGLTLVRTS